MVKLGKTFYLCFQSLPKYVFHSLLKNKKKCHFIYLILFIIFVVEVLTYYYVAYLWSPIECIDNTKCTKILLVADPQLIGLRNEHIQFLTPLSIWDSDRYLSKTYSHAYNFVNPDIVIFLGDLLDEGSTATDKEYQSYVDRFYTIFPKNDIQYIWIPGDNDIGGDHGDYITLRKIQRFDKSFSQKYIVIHKNIRFSNINTLINQAPIVKQSDLKNYTNIALSHLNLLVIPTLFVEKNVLDKLQPKIIFSAHSHKPMIIEMEEESRDRIISRIEHNDSTVYRYDLNDDKVIEIAVPTCSYRMGTDKIGYGFAVLESNKLRYTILWTSSRFLQLRIHAILCIVLFFYYLFRCCCSCKKAESAQYTILERIA